jgi:hypothetical protein
MADSANMFSGGWYAAPSSTAVAATAYTDGVLIPGATLNKVPTLTSTTITAVDTTANGIKFSYLYSLRCAYNVSFAGQIRARCRWQQVAAAPAGAAGRFNMDVRRKDTSGNVSSIAGVVKGQGRPRPLDVGGGATYTENNITVNVPNQTFVPGESIVIVFEFEVTTPAAGNSLSVLLQTDAATSGAELIVEIDSGRAN